MLATASFAVLAPQTVRTQEVQIRPAGAGTIVGVVTDSAGYALDSAEVYLVSARRRTIADSEGRFRFEDVRPGRHEVGARRVGFYPQVRRVAVGDAGGVVNFALVPLRRVLAPIVTSASRGGLSGVVGDTAFNVLADAQVAVISSSRRAVSDSTGQFYIDVPPGKHMVRVTKPGFGSRLLSVTVPKDSGRRVLVWLAPATRANRREDVAIRDMGERLARRSAVYSALFTREDMNRRSTKDLNILAASGVAVPVGDGCLANIGGTSSYVPLWSLSTDDLEALEVYVGRPPRQTVTSIRSGVPRAARPRPAAAGCPTIFAWLRK